MTADVAQVLAAGETLPVLSRHVTQRMIDDYAKASGDFNPIHLHVLAAKAFGFPRAIAHGMWTLGRTIAALHPSKTVRSAVAHGDFKLPLFLPGEATLWSAAPSPTSRDFEVRDLAGDKPHLRGRFEWELP